MDEILDLDDDGNFSMSIGTLSHIYEDMNPFNQSSATVKERVSLSSSGKPKSKKDNMASLMDIICEAINKLHKGLTKTQTMAMDEGNLDSIYDKAYDTLKAIPNLS